ncbi:unnamed protein product [Brassicogethes aeneus]|nr:unnamed protein product [Brassicogethes aeneus]
MHNHHAQSMSHEDQLSAMLNRNNHLLSNEHQAMLHHGSMNHHLKQEPAVGYTPSNHPFSITRLLPAESKTDIKMYPTDMGYGYQTLSPLPNSIHSTSIGNDYYNSPSLYHPTGTTTL